MLQVFRGTFLAGVLAGLALLLGTTPVMAQNDKGEAVRVTTADGVTLHGMFYACPKKDAPTIIFLHKIGDKGLQKKYYSLAEALQKNYAVMLFDFRGHGKSKDVNPAEFWKQPLNAQSIRGGKFNSSKSNIEYTEFNLGYHPTLVNDIAAVKAFLDRKNDNRECNTSSTILIGAESGATLGAIWLNAQWSLVRMLGANPPFQPGNPSPTPEGKDVIACIWMSIDSTFTPKATKFSAVNVTRTLQKPVGMHGCPTVFMYGEANKLDAKRANDLVRALKKGDGKKHELVVPYAIPKTSLRGIDLAQKSVKLENKIAEYLDVVVDRKGGEWTKRDFRNTPYMWRSGGQLVPAKLTGQQGMDPNNLLFRNYEEFVGRQP